MRNVRTLVNMMLNRNAMAYEPVLAAGVAVPMDMATYLIVLDFHMAANVIRARDRDMARISGETVRDMRARLYQS